MFYLTTHSTHFIYGYMASDCKLKMQELTLIRYRYVITYINVTEYSD